MVLGGHTRIQDPHANFRDAFAGSSHSSNDVSVLVCHLERSRGRLIANNCVVCYRNIQSLECVCRVVERQLCHEQREESCADSEDRRPLGFGYLRNSISVGQRRLLRVSTSSINVIDLAHAWHLVLRRSKKSRRLE